MEVLLVWSIVYYGFCRYIHLRGFKSVFYHTGLLDCCFHAMWQLVIAMVCAAACRHGYHMRYWPWWVSLVVPICHVCFFVPLVVGLHLQEHDIQTSQRLTKNKTYDWFNTNPVLVLKTKLEYHAPLDRPYCKQLIAFNTGKQYLQPYLSKIIQTPSGTQRHMLRNVTLQWTEAELYVNQATNYIEKLDDKWRTSDDSKKHEFTLIRSSEDLEPLRVMQGGFTGPTAGRIPLG